MTIQECRDQLWELKFVAGTNQRYHQRLEWWRGLADKCVRIAVGVLAVWGFYLGLKGSDYAGVAEIVAVLSMMVAVVLNVIPTADREKFHGEMFRCWSGVSAKTDMLWSKISAKGPEDNSGDRICEKLEDILWDEKQLHSEEPAPFRRIFQWCEADQRERMYGAGLRTAEAVEKERIARQTAWNDINAQDVPAGAEAATVAQ